MISKHSLSVQNHGLSQSFNEMFHTDGYYFSVSKVEDFSSTMWDRFTDKDTSNLILGSTNGYYHS